MYLCLTPLLWAILADVSLLVAYEAQSLGHVLCPVNIHGLALPVICHPLSHGCISSWCSGG